MSALIRLAGEALPKILESEQGRKAAMTAVKKTGEGLGALGGFAGRAAEDAVLSGAPAAAKFAAKFADKKGLLGRVAGEVATAPTDKIIDTALMAGRVAKAGGARRRCSWHWRFSRRCAYKARYCIFSPNGRNCGT